MSFLEYDVLEKIDEQIFQQTEPYPHLDIQCPIKPGAYQLLRESFPEIKHYRASFNEDRLYGQQPHDRYILEFNVIKKRQSNVLSKPWQAFIRELQGKAHKRYLARMFGVSPYRLSLGFYWHQTAQAGSVSPHCDSCYKIGSTIFYFNTEDEWDQTWGGQTLVLDDHGKLSPRSAPSFEEFDTVMESKCTGNRAFMFERTHRSWHGVRSILPPDNVYRKIFLMSINDRYMVFESKFKARLGIKDRGYIF